MRCRTAGSPSARTWSTCCSCRPRASAGRCRVPSSPVGADELAAVVAALDCAVAGDDPVTVPAAGRPRTTLADARRLAPAGGGDSVRVPTRRVHDLLDVVGEAELDVRRVTTHGRRARRRWPPTTPRAARTVRESLGRRPSSTRRRARRAARAGRAGRPAGRRQPASSLTRAEDARRRLADVRDGAMGLAMVPVRRVVAGFPQLVRELAAPRTPSPARTSTLVLAGAGRRARHPGARRGRRRAAPPGHQRRRPRLRVAGRADRSAGKPAAGDGHRLGPRGRVDGRHRGRRRRARRRRGQPCARSPSPAGCCRPTPTVTGAGAAAAAVRARLLHPRRGHPDLRPRRRPRRRPHGASRTSAAPSRCAPSPGVGTTFVITPAGHARRAALPGRPGRAPSATPCPVPASSRPLGLATAERARGRRRAGARRRDGVPVPLVDLGPGPRTCPGDRDPRAAVVVQHGGAGEPLAWPSTRSRASSSSSSRTSAASSAGCPTVAGATIDGDGTRRAGARRPRARRPPAGRPAAARRRPACGAPNRRTPADAAAAGRAGRGCWSSRTRSACASCSG